MKLHCNKCGESVSTEVPNDTVLRGWIECPECIEKQKNNAGLIDALEMEHALILKLDGIGNITPRCKAEERAQQIIQRLVQGEG